MTNPSDSEAPIAAITYKRKDCVRVIKDNIHYGEKKLREATGPMDRIAWTWT